MIKNITLLDKSQKKHHENNKIEPKQPNQLNSQNQNTNKLANTIQWLTNIPTINIQIDEKKN
jgi:hypothetical protein